MSITLKINNGKNLKGDDNRCHMPCSKLTKSKIQMSKT